VAAKEFYLKYEVIAKQSYENQIREMHEQPKKRRE